MPLEVYACLVIWRWYDSFPMHNLCQRATDGARRTAHAGTVRRRRTPDRGRGRGTPHAPTHGRTDADAERRADGRTCPPRDAGNAAHVLQVRTGRKKNAPQTRRDKRTARRYDVARTVR